MWFKLTFCRVPIILIVYYYYYYKYYYLVSYLTGGCVLATFQNENLHNKHT